MYLVIELVTVLDDNDNNRSHCMQKTILSKENLSAYIIKFVSVNIYITVIVIYLTIGCTVVVVVRCT